MAGIVDIQLARLERRLAARKVTLAMDDSARGWLAEKGYDPAYGARPLKRVIQKALEDPLAEMILGGKVRDGEAVSVSAGEFGLVLGSAPAAPESPVPRSGDAPSQPTVH